MPEEKKAKETVFRIPGEYFHVTGRRPGCEI